MLDKKQFIFYYSALNRLNSKCCWNIIQINFIRVTSNLMFAAPGSLNKIFCKVKFPHWNWSYIDKRSNTTRKVPSGKKLKGKKQGSGQRWLFKVAVFSLFIKTKCAKYVPDRWALFTYRIYSFVLSETFWVEFDALPLLDRKRIANWLTVTSTYKLKRISPKRMHNYLYCIALLFPVKAV